MCACVAGWWNVTVNRSNSVRSPASGRASTSASRNSGLSASSGGKIGELADLLPDDDAEVPQRVEEAVQKPFIGGTNRALEENEQVDIRPQTQLAPAVPAERECGDRLRGRGRRVEQLPQHRVDPRRVAPERGAPAEAARRRVAQFLSRHFERARAEWRDVGHVRPNAPCTSGPA